MASFANERTAISLGDALKKFFFLRGIPAATAGSRARGPVPLVAHHRKGRHVQSSFVNQPYKAVNPRFSLCKLFAELAFSLIPRKDRLRKQCSAGFV
jgi:hypothetical protein